ncbi:unnamed protein product, partial [Adineta steineri]
MHVNDIIDNLEHNWTNIDAGRAQVEKRINIGSYIHELRQHGIIIPKREVPKSLAGFLRMYLNVLRFGSIDKTYSSQPLNPWRLTFTHSFPYLHLRSLLNLSDIFSP